MVSDKLHILYDLQGKIQKCTYGHCFPGKLVSHNKVINQSINQQTPVPVQDSGLLEYYFVVLSSVVLMFQKNIVSSPVSVKDEGNC